MKERVLLLCSRRLDRGCGRYDGLGDQAGCHHLVAVGRIVAPAVSQQYLVRHGQNPTATGSMATRTPSSSSPRSTSGSSASVALSKTRHEQPDRGRARRRYHFYLSAYKDGVSQRLILGAQAAAMKVVERAEPARDRRGLASAVPAPRLGVPVAVISDRIGAIIVVGIDMPDEVWPLSSQMGHAKRMADGAPSATAT